MIEVELRRHVVQGVFWLTQSLSPENFSEQPKGADIA